MRIDACFDSHVHWAATGEFSRRLRLDQLTSAEQIFGVQPEPHHYRGDWLLGFGWDDARWPRAPDRSVLDRWRPGEAIALTRIDGHARWLSTEALRRAGLFDADARLPAGAYVARDSTGEPTGVISDRATEWVDAVLPAPSGLHVRRDLLSGQRIFNRAGFTHVRDLTADETQWNEAVHLDESGLLTLRVDQFFWVRGPEDLSRALDLARRARATRAVNLRVAGVKLFLDGALGSEGALISRCYHGRDHAGVALWTKPQLHEALRCAWIADLDVAVHAIGDEAAARVIDVALELARVNRRGRLHLEHAQVLRDETIAAMRHVDVRCHLQPAHWFGDQAWLEAKIGDLKRFAFPWRRLGEAGIPFHFGSDSPIDEPSVARTLRALRESAAAGVPGLPGDPVEYFTHPDPSWAENSYTLFDGERPREVVFRGEHLI